MNVITNKEDGDLFNIANNFGIRHHRIDQKTDMINKYGLNGCFIINTCYY
jgi:hypothetical protein